MFSTLVAPNLAAHMGGIGFGFGILFFLIPLLIIGLLFLAGGLARRRWSRNGNGNGNGNGFGPGPFVGAPIGYGHSGAGHGVGHGASHGAESTLAERFAQGDIDEKEYRARLEVLRTNNQFTPAQK